MKDQHQQFLAKKIKLKLIRFLDLKKKSSIKHIEIFKNKNDKDQRINVVQEDINFQD